MTVPFRVALLDIEGTVAPIDYVTATLFPFARTHLADFLARRGDEPAVRAARALLAVEADEPAAEADIAVAVRAAMRLMDADAKATGLKQLQGLIWAEGYAAGALRSQLFPDVPATLRAWYAAGVTLAVYSSGSVAAQKVFFAHTEAGELSGLFAAHFDTTTGPKRDAASYRAIAEQLRRPAGDVRFFSDVPAELDAAREAGMQTRLVVRPGNAPMIDGHGHQSIGTLID